MGATFRSHLCYTKKERKLAVQYYLVSKKSFEECSNDLGLKGYTLPSWVYRSIEEDKHIPDGVSAEELKDAFFESIRRRSKKNKNKKECKKRFYRPTSSSMVYLR